MWVYRTEKGRDGLTQEQLMSRYHTAVMAEKPFWTKDCVPRNEYERAHQEFLDNLRAIPGLDTFPEARSNEFQQLWEVNLTAVYAIRPDLRPK